jgi:hypothetical protein
MIIRLTFYLTTRLYFINNKKFNFHSNYFSPNKIIVSKRKLKIKYIYIYFISPLKEKSHHLF